LLVATIRHWSFLSISEKRHYCVKLIYQCLMFGYFAHCLLFYYTVCFILQQRVMPVNQVVIIQTGPPTLINTQQNPEYRMWLKLSKYNILINNEDGRVLLQEAMKCKRNLFHCIGLQHRIHFIQYKLLLYPIYALYNLISILMTMVWHRSISYHR